MSNKHVHPTFSGIIDSIAPKAEDSAPTEAELRRQLETLRSAYVGATDRIANLLAGRTPADTFDSLRQAFAKDIQMEKLVNAQLGRLVKEKDDDRIYWRTRAEKAEASLAEAPTAVEVSRLAEWLFIQTGDEGQAYLTWCANAAAIAQAVAGAVYVEPDKLDEDERIQVEQITSRLVEDGFFDFEGDPGLKLFRVAGNGLATTAATPASVQGPSEAGRLASGESIRTAASNALDVFQTICTYADAADLGPTVIEEIGDVCDELRAALAAIQASPTSAVERETGEATLAALSELYYALPDVLHHGASERFQKTGKWANQDPWVLRGRMTTIKYRSDDMASVYAAMDRANAILSPAPTVATPAAIDALETALIAECERAMLQRDEFKRTGVSTASHGGSHDTCFGLILRSHGVASTPAEPAKAAGSAVDAFWSGTLSDRNKPA